MLVDYECLGENAGERMIKDDKNAKTVKLK